MDRGDFCRPSGTRSAFPALKRRATIVRPLPHFPPDAPHAPNALSLEFGCVIWLTTDSDFAL